MANVDDDKMQDTVDAAADGVRAAVDKTADAVSGVARAGSDSVSESVGSAARALNDAVDTAQKKVSTGLHQASEAVSDISDKATGAIKKYPIQAVILAAIGAAVLGFIVGVVTSKKG
ncbi:MAG: type VII secretion target [Terrimesophilobacter sp.]